MFFFFKQKTAYEMRISEWSSDVCSSDLRIMGAARSEQRDAAGDRFRRGILADRDHVHARLEIGLAAFEAAPLHIAARAADARGIGRSDLGLRLEIGKFPDQQAEQKRQQQDRPRQAAAPRSEEHTSELQSLMRISYAGFCLKKKKKQN